MDVFSIRFKRIWVHKYFCQSKMVLDIPKGVKNVDKVKEEEEEANLKKKVIVALTG